MFFAGLSGIQGYDTVVRCDIAGYKPGDLLKDADGMFLCIGKEVVFPQLYQKIRSKSYNFKAPEKIYKSLLSQKAMDMIHWMVQHYFSSYKHVIGLYIPDNIEKRLHKNLEKHDGAEQSVHIYPDVWSLTQSRKEVDLESKVILHGGLTQVQKTKIFRGVKEGSIKTLFATNRGLFFDWADLKNIYIHDPDNRSYSSQSDPRFVLLETAQKIADLYGATIVTKR